MGVLTKEKTYHSPEQKTGLFAKIFPGLVFYPKMIHVVWKAAQDSKKGIYNYEGFSKSSQDILKALEFVGTRIEIENLDVIQNLKPPAVFVANHMSTFETFTLPGLLCPYFPTTYIVKEDLKKYPVFKHVMFDRDPIWVSRKNPREDYAAVLTGGVERLKKGISIVVFPQTTRMVDFNPNQFNSIGIKLAKRAGVPVVPIALKTDAWGNGKLVKDFGKIDPKKKIYFSFGQPLTIRGNGKEQHEATVQFIQEKLNSWKD